MGVVGANRLEQARIGRDGRSAIDLDPAIDEREFGAMDQPGACGVEAGDITDLDDRFLWRANATFVWNPLYGKLSFLNNKLGHFDFNLAVGAGVVSVERPSLDRSVATTEIAPELVLGTGVHFLFNSHWSVRADGRFYVYQGAESSSNEGDFLKQVALPTEFLLGVSYMF